MRCNGRASFADHAVDRSIVVAGGLCPEPHEPVVQAIEQLGGDGRMIGVITHVQELAIRLPVRIDVEKSLRGSRLQVVT